MEKTKRITDAILNKLQLDIRDETSITENFKKPNQIEKIKENLYLSYDDAYSVSTIKGYLDEQDRDNMTFYKIFAENIPLTDHLNPHYEYSPEAYYQYLDSEGNEYRHLVELGNLLNHRTNSDGKPILNLIDICHNRGGIVQIGERGSGKTLTQNIWLSKNNKTLEENKIVWIRLDASKLFEIWDEAPSINIQNITTVEEYLMSQLVYVFAKHYIKDSPLESPLFVEIAQKLSSSPENNILPSLYTTKKQVADSYIPYEILAHSAKRKNREKITDCLKYYEEIISVSEGLNKGTGRKSKEERVNRRGSFMINYILKASQEFPEKYKGRKAEWVEVGKILKKFIIDNGYYILYIIDGLDNINFFNEKSKDYLETIFTQMSEFPLKTENVPNLNELLFLSMRDTTYNLLRRWNNQKYFDRVIHKDISSFIEIRQYSSGIQKPAFNKRIEYVLKKYKGPDCYMKKVIRDMYDYHIIPDETRWNSNIRCFMFNHLNLAKYITFRYFFSKERDEGNFNIRAEISKFEEINYLINGELFIDEDYSVPITNKGNNFFNLFGYKDAKNKPNYLIYMRILQIINNSSINVPEHQLYAITDLFEYNRNDVAFCIQRLVIIGMIKSDYDPGTTGRGIIKYSKSNMTGYVLKKFLSNIHFLYHCSVDTLLPDSVINRLRFQINNIEFLKKNKTNYPPNSIITGVKLLEFFCQRNNYELKKLRNKIDINNNSINQDSYNQPPIRDGLLPLASNMVQNNLPISLLHNETNINVNSYKLPICFEELRSSVENMVQISLREKEYETILTDYFGI